MQVGSPLIIVLVLALSMWLAPIRTPAQEPVQAQPVQTQTLQTQPASPGTSPAYDQGAQSAAPVVVPPITYFDIATGKFGSLEITLKDGQFASSAVDVLHVKAADLDLGQGILKSISIEFDNGHFKDFIIDHLSMSSQGNLVFDTGMLMTNKVLQFTTPATAAVSAEISQKSLNSYLNSTRTLQKLSVTAGQKMAVLSALLGPNFGLVFSQAALTLKKDDRIKLEATAKLGAGDAGVPIPMTLDSHLGLADGWAALSDTHIVTAGSELPPEISNMLIKKVNSLSSWGSKSDDIHFQFNKIKVIPNDKFVLTGTAQVYRLVFGHNEQ